MTLLYRQALDDDFPAVSRMLELYQHDLSDIWDQEVDAQGLFGYDLERHRKGQRFVAHVALANGHFAGVALVAPAIVTQTDGCWLEQFFILKKYRHSGVGRAFAQHVFARHPGPWEVGQMPKNLAAQAFWRKVISQLTKGAFTEVQVEEGWWLGTVQRFTYGAATVDVDRPVA